MRDDFSLSGDLVDVVVNLVHPNPPAGLAYIPLREDEYVVCCARNHRLAARAHVSLSELSKERWTFSEPGLPPQQRLHEIFQNNGLESPRVALRSRSLTLRLEAAANSDLLLFTSRAIARRFGAGLQVLPVRELCWVRSVGVLHRKEPYLAPAVRRLIEIFKRTTSSARTNTMPVRLRRAARQSERG
jgi:DNA-binding transcriptional LysR family regulator